MTIDLPGRGTAPLRSVPVTVLAEEARLPRRVHGAVRPLLAAVSAECRQLLYTAAVVGERPDPELVADMLGCGTAALLPAWEEALGSDLLRADGEHIVFAHEPLRLAVADSVPVALRRALERQRDRLLPAPEPAPAEDRLRNRLTAREATVLGLLAQGRSNHQIARELGVSDHAVKRHVSNLLIKFDCANRTELALLATGS